MVSLPPGVDFLLKHSPDFICWGLQLVSDHKENQMALKSMSATTLTINDSDFKLLNKTIEMLQNDKNSLKKWISKQRLAEMRASNDHIMSGLIHIKDSVPKTIQTNPQQTADFVNANYTNVKQARNEFDKAYSLARVTYRDETLKFTDRVFSFKMVLFCQKMLHENWRSLWEQDLDTYLKTNKITKAFEKRSGIEFDATVELMLLVKNATGDNHCLRSVYDFFKTNSKAVEKFFKDRKNGAKAVQLMQIHDSDSALHVAARQLDVKLLEHAIKMELKKSKTVDVENEYGSTPLLSAAYSGCVNNVELLLKNGASVHHKKEDGWTALHLAAYEGKLECLQLLLLAGAGVYSKTNVGNTALHTAASNGKVDCVKLLLEAKSPIDDLSNDGTALYYAAKNGHLAVMKLLVKSGANLNLSTTTKYNPILYACFNGHVECVLYLLQQGVKTSQLSETDGQKYVDTATLAAIAGDRLNILQLLANHKALEQIPGWNRYTPLHYAASYTDNPKIVEFVIENGAVINAKDKDGRTPLYVGCQGNKIKIVQVLLEHKAAPNVARYNSYTPIIDAAQTGNEECLRLLLEHGGMANVKCRISSTPLHHASAKCRPGCIIQLIHSGADVNALTDSGKTPLDWLGRFLAKTDLCDEIKTECREILFVNGALTGYQLKKKRGIKITIIKQNVGAYTRGLTLAFPERILRPGTLVLS